MTELKTESTPDQNGLFNYPNKLPDGLTYKDIDYLRKRVDSGKSNEYPKPNKIRYSIAKFVKNHKDQYPNECVLFGSLLTIIIFSFMLAFSVKGINVGHATLLYVWPIWVLTSYTIDLIHTLTAISIVENKYLKTIRASIVRNALPILALLIPAVLLFDRYTSQSKEPVQPTDFAISLVIIVFAYATMKVTKIKKDKALAKFKIKI